VREEWKREKCLLNQFEPQCLLKNESEKIGRKERERTRIWLKRKGEITSSS